MVSRQGSKLYAAVVGQWAGNDQERINRLLRKARKDRIEVASGAGVEDFNSPPNGQSRSPNVRDNALGRGPLGIGEHANARGFRPQLMQEPKLLCSKFRQDETDTGDVATGAVEAGDEAVPDRVAPGCEDDRYRRGCGFGHNCRLGVMRSDHCYLTAYQISCEVG